ncbi:MAG: GFA family protein [Rhodobacteraceae bacterium]|nr:GFA family protein [Paracoccaceae bacterium]
MVKGSCECGAIVFELQPPLGAVVACHCTQCRKTSGHIWAATAVDDANLRISLLKAGALRWYRSSAIAQRAFCTECGASLFYKRDDSSKTSVGAGALDSPTHLQLSQHIFVRDKGDYYTITCPMPQKDTR